MPVSVPIDPIAATRSSRTQCAISVAIGQRSVAGGLIEMRVLLSERITACSFKTSGASQPFAPVIGGKNSGVRQFLRQRDKTFRGCGRRWRLEDWLVICCGSLPHRLAQRLRRLGPLPADGDAAMGISAVRCFALRCLAPTGCATGASSSWIIARNSSGWERTRRLPPSCALAHRWLSRTKRQPEKHEREAETYWGMK